MEKKVTKINLLPKRNADTKRVGIYCRVSSNSNSQLHSLVDQASGLAQYVYCQPLMLMADIFLDVTSPR